MGPEVTKGPDWWRWKLGVVAWLLESISMKFSLIVCIRILVPRRTSHFESLPQPRTILVSYVARNNPPPCPAKFKDL